VTAPLITACGDGFKIHYTLKPGWHTDNLSLTWTDQFLPIVFNLDYQLYIKDIYNQTNVTILGRTKDSYYEILPDQEGDFLLGVNAIKSYNGEYINESPICWSNDSSCVNEGDVFYLTVQYNQSGDNKDPIYRWKIVWKYVEDIINE
jgi:hypothetical protein